MSIKLYVGLQGSGKSYEVVSVVILGALREGRRVVSNIAGLNYEKMRELLIEEGTDPALIGTILQVDHDDVLKSDFFRTDTDDATGFKTIVQGGDVLVLDEIWRFWESDKSVSMRAQNFFRMHRHMLHPDSGLSCEIVLISQDVMDVCRKIRAVVEKSYQMTKHTELGVSNRYRVSIYSRAKISEYVEPINSIQKSYEPKYFELYKSYSAGGDVTDPREMSIDSRGNIFSRPLFKYGFPIVILLMIPAIIFFLRFFNPKPVEDSVVDIPVSTAVVSSSVRSNSQPDTSDEWKVIGFYSKPGSMTFVVTDGFSVRTLINPPNYKIFPMGSTVELPEGGFATSWAALNRKDGLL